MKHFFHIKNKSHLFWHFDPPPPVLGSAKLSHFVNFFSFFLLAVNPWRLLLCTVHNIKVGQFTTVFRLIALLFFSFIFSGRNIYVIYLFHIKTKICRPGSIRSDWLHAALGLIGHILHELLYADHSVPET